MRDIDVDEEAEAEADKMDMLGSKGKDRVDGVGETTRDRGLRLRDISGEMISEVDCVTPNSAVSIGVLEVAVAVGVDTEEKVICDLRLAALQWAAWRMLSGA